MPERDQPDPEEKRKKVPRRRVRRLSSTRERLFAPGALHEGAEAARKEREQRDALEDPVAHSLIQTRLADPAVQALLAQWEEVGRPIEYGDLNQVAALIGVENPKASTRRKIVEAVEGAGIEIDDLDGWRRSIAETGRCVSLGAAGAMRVMEEWRWRRPEYWDDDRRRQRETCVHVRRRSLEYTLKCRHAEPGDEILPWPDDEERWT
jgi:hypothetical protein